MELIKKTFTLPPRCSVSSITIRELNGTDELRAAQLADIECAGKELSQVAMMGVENKEAMRLSIWAVDGERVNNPDPYTDLNNWNMRTDRFLYAAFQDVNGCTGEELENFIKGGAPHEETQSGKEVAPELATGDS